MELFRPVAKEVDIDRLVTRAMSLRGGETNAHIDLVLCAACWLEARGFSVIFRPSFWLFGGGYVVPDVYGRSLTDCTNAIAEAKASRSDVYCSFPKYRKLIRHSRGTWSPIAEHHFIIAPKGLVGKSEVPKLWGLLEVKGDHVEVLVAPTRVECRMKVRNRTSGVEWIKEKLFQSV